MPKRDKFEAQHHLHRVNKAPPPLSLSPKSSFRDAGIAISKSAAVTHCVMAQTPFEVARNNAMRKVLVQPQRTIHVQAVPDMNDDIPDDKRYVGLYAWVVPACACVGRPSIGTV